MGRYTKRSYLVKPPSKTKTCQCGWNLTNSPNDWQRLNLFRIQHKRSMATILAADSGHTFRPIRVARESFKAFKDALRWVGLGLVPGKRISDYGLYYPYPMRYIGFHSYTYAVRSSFTCNRGAFFRSPWLIENSSREDWQDVQLSLVRCTQLPSMVTQVLFLF